MKYLVSWLLIVDVSVLFLSSAAEKIQRSCVDKDDAKKTAKLNCGNNGGEIFDVSVLLGNGSCNTTAGHHCNGLTPSVLVDSFSCFWKASCTINWPYDTVITPGETCSLIGARPDFMQVSYKCFEPNATRSNEAILLDICEGDAGSDVERSAEPGLSGIVRSHRIYPWDYTDTARTCILKFPWPFDSARKVQQKLIVSIQDLDLSQGDSLSISALGPDGVEAKTYVIHSENYAKNNITLEDEKNTYLKAKFNFTVGTESVRGKGFVVCFKFADKDDKEDNGTNYACANFVRDGNIENVESASEPEGLLQTTSTPIKTASTVNVVVDTTTVLPEPCTKKKDVKSQQKCSKNFYSKQKGGKKKDKKDKKDKTKVKKDKKENRTRRHNKAS